MEVSENGGTPNSSILGGLSILSSSPFRPEGDPRPDARFRALQSRSGERLMKAVPWASEARRSLNAGFAGWEATGQNDRKKDINRFLVGGLNPSEKY